MDWKECLQKRIVKEKQKDEELIKSLLEKAEDKLHSSKMLKLTDKTAESKFILVYDYLRETLEGITIKKGFKIYNHECYTSFLKEFCNLETEALIFDKLRLARNNTNYYENKLLKEDSENLIKEAIELTKRLKLIFLGKN